jgi:hypothetical protein
MPWRIGKDALSLAADDLISSFSNFSNLIYHFKILWIVPKRA